jgi:hypothetical protein
MSLNIKKLSNVSEKPDGKLTARCPACALDGKDKKGDRLVVYPDGKFGCVKYEKDATHRKLIHSIAGDGVKKAHVPQKLPVRPFKVEKSTAVMNLGHYPRFSNATKRQWPPQDKPREQPAGAQMEEPPQMEFPFMNAPLQAPPNKLAQFPTKISNFNVPPKPADTSYPALPPNPMRGRV